MTHGTHHANLLSKIESATVRVGIIGLGYVGLPLARAFAERGIAVLGFDIDPAKVAKLERGESYIGHIPDATIRQMREQGFEATRPLRPARRARRDHHLRADPADRGPRARPDLRRQLGPGHRRAAAARPARRPGEHDLPRHDPRRRPAHPRRPRPGAGPRLLPRLQPRARGPGQPAVLGADDPQGRRRPRRREPGAGRRPLREGRSSRSCPSRSPEVAEACKILENTYRAVNIALVNELKVLFDRMGIDVWEVIEAAKTKPFGFQAFYPGPGLGGHCIPIDPFYLTWVARKHGLTTRFIELAGEINTAMPAYVVSKVADALNDDGKPVKGSKITLLGMAYKKDVDDPRESPGFELMDLLLQKGAVVNYNDPHIPALPPMRHYPHLQMASQELTPEYLRSQDCVLIVTDHSAYDWAWIAEHAPLIVDTRNAMKNVSSPRGRIVRA